MKSVFIKCLCPVILALLLSACSTNIEVIDNQPVWHTVVLTLNGPEAIEDSLTFRNYRLNVTFTQGEDEFIVPGYFAADGNAENTSASAGNKWRVKFTPNKAGEWMYTISFKTGENIAASTDPGAGKPLGLDGKTGRITVQEADTGAEGFFGKGSLWYVGERYLQYQGSKEWFVKAGPGGPENFLGYADFDSTYNVPGGVNTDTMLGDNRLHEYEPHLDDWTPGDPTWHNGKGKGIIGAINYIADKGMNNLYMVTNNVEGDGRDCWPWTNYEARDVYDVSKLAQWDIVFQHMNNKGVEVNFYFWEAENDKLLNSGNMGTERKIYYRELIARFGYLPGLRWNIAEEPQLTTEQVLANAEFIKTIDPYDRAVGVHCGYKPEHRLKELPPLYGSKFIDGAWMQIHNNHHQEILRYKNGSDSAGRKWVVSVDEPQPISTTNSRSARKKMWEVLTAGGEGFDVYFGYGGGTCDIANEDFRNRDTIWTQLAYSLDLFQRPHINQMLPSTQNHNELGNGYILANPGELYIIYQNDENDANLNLTDYPSTFKIEWLNPVNGGGLQTGAVTEVTGGQEVSLGSAPAPGTEWVIIVTKKNK